MESIRTMRDDPDVIKMVEEIKALEKRMEEPPLAKAA